MNLEIGQVVGQYVVTRKIGSGGMAVVYEAEHQKLGRMVALKMMHAGFQDDEDLLARFDREARIVAGLDHPNIVPIYDFDEFNGTPYLVMKIIDGQTLKLYMRKQSPTLSEIDKICSAVAEALSYAHEHGVLHRDVKPANVMLAHDGTPYLTDFGLARVVAHGESSLSAGMIVGTPHYIAPEQASGELEISAGADVYALGVVLYEMVVGQVPFAGGSTHAIIHDHIYTPPPPPSEVNPEIPAEVETVLLTALEKDPSDRYTSPRDLMNAYRLAIQSSGLTELSEDRSQVAERSLLARRKQKPLAGVAPVAASTSTATDTFLASIERDVNELKDELVGITEFELDMGKMREALPPFLNNAWTKTADAMRRKFNPTPDRPYTPPTESELESQIRERVSRRMRARRGWWVHFSIFLVVSVLIAFGMDGGQEAIAQSIMDEVAIGAMSQPEAEMAVVWATQPWGIMFILFWFSGVMAHRMAVNNQSARQEDKRGKKLMQSLERQYGTNWEGHITETQFAAVENSVRKRFKQITGFWAHFWTFIIGNLALFVGWQMVAEGLRATSNFLIVTEQPDAEVIAAIAAEPRVLAVTSVWAIVLFIHGLITLLGRNRTLEAELARERQLTLSRQTPRPDKRKHEAAALVDDEPRPVRLNADGELTNSTVEAWNER